MSVIQRIRDKGKWILFAAIVLALVAFILQDAFKSDNGGGDSSTLGEVNGTSIDRKDFDAKVSEYEQMYAMRNMTPQHDQLYAGAWNDMVQLTILQQEYEKLGLSFTGKEQSDVFFSNNAPANLKQIFTDPSTGEYKIEEARNSFAHLKRMKDNDPQKIAFIQLIQSSIDQILAQKYQSLVAAAVYFPKWVNSKMDADNNSIAKMGYVYVPYTSAGDSSIKITNEEINAYVKAHKNEFTQEQKSRTISYITFSAAPNTADSAVVRTQLNELKADFASAGDVKSFIAAKGSSLPFADMYITKSNMKMPSADSIMQLHDGQIIGPYIDGQNYNLAKMIGRRTIPDSIKCRHILVKTHERGMELLSDSVAKRKMDTILAAIRAGVDFNTVLQRYSDDAKSNQTGEYEFAATQFSGISKEFAEVVFYGNTGDKKVVKVENASYGGYHYIEVITQKNRQEAYKVAYISKPIAASMETINAAQTAAQQFAAIARNKKQFDETVAKQKLEVLPSQEIGENDYSVTGLGENRNFVKWIYEHNVGDVSEPTQVGDRYVVAVITNINKEGLLSAHTARPYVESILKNEKKAQQIIAGIKGNTLEACAQSTKTTVQLADTISFAQPLIPGVGNEPKVVGAAFNKALLTKISDPIAGVSGVFVIKTEAVSAVPSANPADQQKAIEFQMRRQAAYGAMEALRKAAIVKDYRFKFY